MLDFKKMKRKLYTRHEPILLPFYPRFVYLTLVDRGYADQQIFSGLEFGANQLQDENYRLSIAQHEQFILRVLALTKDPHFAIELSKNNTNASQSYVLLAIANSGKISKALHLIMRYNQIFTRTFSIQSLNIGDQVVMDIEPQLEHDSVIYFALSSFVFFLDNFFRKVLRGVHLVRQVELAISKPKGFDKISGEFGMPISFNHPHTRIYLNKDHLDQPMQQADPQTVRLLIEMSERQLQEVDTEIGFLGAVKSILIENISSPPKLDDAARLLGVSSRSLRRKLEQSKTSYQKLLDSVRLKVATKLLNATNEPVSSIAYELGYDNASDFGRAFKKWQGQSPSSYRNKAI